VGELANQNAPTSEMKGASVYENVFWPHNQKSSEEHTSE
jgi:hypothetical protein